MEYNFDEIIERRDTDCAKWDLTDPDVLALWVADMDFRAPAEVQAALMEAVQHGVFGYPYYGTCVQEAAADWLFSRHGWEVSPESVVLIPGVVTGFNLAANAATAPGDGVLVQTPAYGPFLKVDKNFGLSQQVHQLDQDPDGRYVLDIEAFKAAIRPETRIFMLCNPQNPTGRVFTKDELTAMAEVCLQHDILICSDEIHSDLIYSGNKHIPIAALDPEIAARTITLLAPSKTFNVAGLKASVAVIENEELRKEFEAARQGLVGFVNLMGAEAMQAAYLYGAPWLEAALTYLEANRDFVVEFVRERLPGVKMAAPEGTYLAWLDCRELAIAGVKEGTPFNDFYEREARVALNDGIWFGPGGEGFVRLNFACPRSILVEALERMQGALAAG